MDYLKCKKCGGEYELQPGESPEDFESCECGGSLKFVENNDSITNKDKDSLICPKCQFKNPNDAIFCGNCKYKLRDDRFHMKWTILLLGIVITVGVSLCFFYPYYVYMFIGSVIGGSLTAYLLKGSRKSKLVYAITATGIGGIIFYLIFFNFGYDLYGLNIIDDQLLFFRGFLLFTTISIVLGLISGSLVVFLESKKSVNNAMKRYRFIIVGIIVLICLVGLANEIYELNYWNLHSKFTVQNPDPTAWEYSHNEIGWYEFVIFVRPNTAAYTKYSLEKYHDFDLPYTMGVYLVREQKTLESAVNNEKELTTAKVLIDRNLTFEGRNAYEYSYITFDNLGSFSLHRNVFIEDNGGIYKFYLELDQLESESELYDSLNATEPDFEFMLKSFKT